MYYFAEYFHFSGVLSVVSGGLFLSSKRQQMLSYMSRIQGVNVWTNIVFVLNGLVFFLIGLQLPSIVSQLGDTSLRKAIGYGLAISLILIIVRLLCTLGASIFTRFMSHFITVADANPGWKGPIIFGWSGMRGVVSLAAALSIPILVSGGQPFPFRNLILFITFVVILVTLVLQGLTLPWLIQKLKLEDRGSLIPEAEQEIIIQRKMAQYSLQYLEDKYGVDRLNNEHLNNLQASLRTDLKLLNLELEKKDDNEDPRASYQLIFLEILEQQRKLLDKMNHKAEFDEELIRKYHALIDLEEFKAREKLTSNGKQDV